MNGYLILKINNGFKVFAGVGYDLEGTVVNLDPLHHKAHRMLAEVLDVILPENLDEIIKLIPNFVGGPDRVVMEQIRELAKKLGTDNEKLEEWPIEKMLEYKDALFDGFFKNSRFEPRQDVALSMQMLETLGIPYGICSVTRSLQAQEIIEKSGLLAMFSGRPIILRPDVRKGKPDPEVYQRIAQEFGIKTGELLVFEDSLPGVMAGITAGATVFAVPAAYSDEDKLSEERKKRLEEAGAIVFNDWTEVNKFFRENAYVYLEGVINSDEGLNIYKDGKICGSLIKAFGAHSLLEYEHWRVGSPEAGLNGHRTTETL